MYVASIWGDFMRDRNRKDNEKIGKKAPKEATYEQFENALKLFIKKHQGLMEKLKKN